MKETDIIRLKNKFYFYIQKIDRSIEDGSYLIAYDYHSRAIAIMHLLDELGYKVEIHMIKGNTGDERYTECMGYIKDWGADYQKIFCAILEKKNKNYIKYCKENI